MNLNAPQNLADEQDKIIVSANALVKSSRLVPRSIRYQVARFCKLEKMTPDEYLYRLTPGSLKAAQQQGLRVQHLLTLLRHHAKNVPPSLVKALKRWDGQGNEVEIYRPLVLSVKDPEMLNVLRSSKASRYLSKLLGPTTIMVNEGSQEKILAILAEIGYLGEVEEN